MFTKIVVNDKSVSYLNLEGSLECFVKQSENKYSMLSKISLDPKQMTLDLTDLRFESSTSIISDESNLRAKIDLTETFFMFEDGSKVLSVIDENVDLRKIGVKVDSKKLIDEKYQFILDYAPQMWLNERQTEDEGWYPGQVSTFIDQMSLINPNGQGPRMTTTIPLESPFEKREFFHGEKPDSNGLGVPVQTFIMPTNATLSTMDPLEMLLNPDQSKIEVYYIYFFPYDWVKYRLGNHVGDVERT